MSKLAVKDRFLDLSDYGRLPAVWLANKLKNTSATPIHITFLFGFCGLSAAYCIIIDYHFLAAILLIAKSILDAADGELSRVKNTPSHSGRYLDSIFDIILNFLFVLVIFSKVDLELYWVIIAFVSIQIQGTLYNYYYVILRNRSTNSDTTSKIFEHSSPPALPGESQKVVNLLFAIFYLLYGAFDKLVFLLDQNAFKVRSFPNWFMTLVSAYGLGFQLLIMAVMLAFGMIDYILMFFIWYNMLIVLILWLRRYRVTL
jgi:phosphatidylglycerophosphate synthase